MKKFTVYDNSGKILRTGHCPDNMFEAQKRDDELIIEGEFPTDGSHRVEAGVVVKDEKFNPSSSVRRGKPEEEKTKKLQSRIDELEKIVSGLVEKCKSL